MASITALTRAIALTPALALLLGASLAAADPNRAQAKANFQSADANGDSMLSFEEFTTLINLNADHNIGRAQMIRRHDRYAMAFGRIDANEDGLVTPEEMAAIARR